jgi:hypothetical protein
MFDWFKGKDKDSNVVDFPRDYIKPIPDPIPEPAKIFYRIGVTDSNRVAFSMGMSEITMTKAGVENLIQQLQVFRDQLSDEDE